MMGVLNNTEFQFAHSHAACHKLRVGSKKSIQQGRSQFWARSVPFVREHRKLARTPLVAFFNRPMVSVYDPGSRASDTGNGQSKKGQMEAKAPR
jgi:hypothetical protein